MLNCIALWRSAFRNPKEEKMFEKRILPLFIKREIAQTSFFAGVLPTYRVLNRAENIAPKQFQLRDIVMGRFNPAVRFALRYPTSLPGLNFMLTMNFSSYLCFHLSHWSQEKGVSRRFSSGTSSEGD